MLKLLKKLVWWIPACAMMVLIFRFSMATGEESSSLSSKISDFLEIPEFLVRKAAHVTEYFILTLFISLGLIKGMGLRRNKTLFFMGIIAFAYATSDEIHQRFVGGRSGNVKDVFIDGIGIILAIFLIYFFNRKRIN